MTNSPSAPATPGTTLPVVVESAVVTREREQTGAVRVRIETTDNTQDVPVERSVERVQVERVAVGRACDQRQAPWYEAGVLVVPVYEEVVTISRQLVLKEEIRVQTTRTTTSDVQAVSLRQERAIVERLQEDGSWAEVTGP